MRIKRVLVNALIRSIIPTAISFIMWLGLFWFLGSVLMGPVSSSGLSGLKVYKNYIEQPFTDEAVKEVGQTDKEILTKSNTSDNNKAVAGDFVIIPVRGAITSDHNSYQNLFDQLLIASQKNSKTKAVIFYVNSPGGEVTACDNLYNEIIKLRGHGIKTVAFVNAVSASGAYYITAGSDKMIASPTAIVGSIGVIMELYNLEGLAGKIGVKMETIKSSEMKDLGSPFRKMSEKERVVLQKVVDDSYKRFVSIVKNNRKLTDAQVKAVATGEVWTAEEAMLLGLIDEVGYLKKAVDTAKELTGVTNPRLIIYQKEVGLFDTLMAGTSFLNLPKPEKVIQDVLLPPRLLYQWIP